MSRSTRSPSDGPAARRAWARPLLVAAVAALMLVVVPSAAQAATGTDSRHVSFSASVFDSATNETVDLTGQMHVVTTLTGSAAAGWTVDLRARLHDTLGTGRTSGACYVATGADTGTAHYPPGPPGRAVFQTSFSLYPPGPPADQGNFEQQGSNQGNFEHPPSPCHNQAIPPGPPGRTALALSVTVSFNVDGSVASVGIQPSSST